MRRIKINNIRKQEEGTDQKDAEPVSISVDEPMCGPMPDIGDDDRQDHEADEQKAVKHGP